MALANLGMYSLPAVADAIEAWWDGLARAFIAEGLEDVPETLSGGDMHALWNDPDLLFAQTCGYPLTHEFKDKLQVIATPAYGAEGCTGCTYRSAFIVRRDEPAQTLDALRGRKAAINSPDSQSGYSALRHAIAPLAERGRFFDEVIESGGHRASMQTVASRRADVASVDCITLALMQRHDDALTDSLRVLGYSAAAPGLPYVTAHHRSRDSLDRLRAGLGRACADPGLEDARRALLIEGFEVLPETAYERILEMETEAAALGYPQVA